MTKSFETIQDQPFEITPPEFMVPFDGTQPEASYAEREYVGVGFENLVSDLYLNYPSDTVATEQSAVLALMRIDNDPNKKWNIVVSQQGEYMDVNAMEDDPEYAELYDHDPSDMTRAELRLIRLVPGGYRSWAYRLAEDGTVRRIDEETRQNGQQQQLDAFHTSLEDQIAGERLERDMGINNQPIGVAEMRGLEAFMYGGKLEPARAS
jgi:hypothetical protein